MSARDGAGCGDASAGSGDAEAAGLERRAGLRPSPRRPAEPRAPTACALRRAGGGSPDCWVCQGPRPPGPVVGLGKGRGAAHGSRDIPHPTCRPESRLATGGTRGDSHVLRNEQKKSTKITFTNTPQLPARRAAAPEEVPHNGREQRGARLRRRPAPRQAPPRARPQAAGPTRASGD